MIESSTYKELEAVLAKPHRSPPGIAWIDGNKPLVLFGAGIRGRKVLAALRKEGVEPIAFADNQRALWGQTVDGLPLLSPDEAARIHRDAVFVVTIWSDSAGHPYEAVRVQLNQLGVSCVASFTALCELYPQRFFPDFFLDHFSEMQGHQELIRSSVALWADESSAREYIAQLRLRFTLDFSGLPMRCEESGYFPPDLFSLTDDETFVDCGAYNGDTFRSFRIATRGRFRCYVGIEPDPSNYRQLVAEVGDLVVGSPPKARLHAVCLAEEPGWVDFTADGSQESRAQTQGAHRVKARALDDILEELSPTYIKMDIEGGEVGALRGARRIIKQHRPILAVSVYHRVRELWELPHQIAEMTEGYRYHLRAEKNAGWDLVCYAIPCERAIVY